MPTIADMVPERWVRSVVGSALVGLVTGLVILGVKVLVEVCTSELLAAAPWVIGLVLFVGAVATPLIWFVAASTIAGSTSEAMEEPVFVVALAVIALVSVPITLRLLIYLFTPELTQTGSRRLTLAIVVLVAVVGPVGFAFGRNNDRYMTCSDFALAGASEPENSTR